MKNLSLFLVLLLFTQTVFAAGKLQGADFKTEAELIAAGATKAQLLDDSKIYITANGINDKLNNAITNGQIGGSPSGVVNLLNGGFENSLTGWTTYKNTAQSQPVSGTGGSPTSTLSTGCASGCTVTTSPLYGTKSGVLTHPASNVQGEGASYDFSIDPALQGKVLNLNGAYKVLSGTFSGGSSTTDSDVEVYFYDKTNGVVIQPNGYKLTDGGITGQNYDFNASFQAASNSTSYRIIFHYPNTTATAFTVAVDIASIGQVSRAANAPRPQLLGTVRISGCASTWSTTSGTYVNFTAVTGCTYTITGGAISAPSTLVPGFQLSQQVAPGVITVQFQGNVYNSGTTGTVGGGVAITDGTTTYAGTQTSAYAGLSQPTAAAPVASGIFQYSSAVASGTTFQVKGARSNSGTLFVDATGASGSLNEAAFSVWYTPSIASQTNDLGSQRVVIAQAAANAALTITSGSPVIYPSVSFDSHGAYSSSTGAFTCPEAGYYSTLVSGFQVVTGTGTGFVSLSVFKNGSFVSKLTTTQNSASVSQSSSGTADVYCKAGEALTVVPDSSNTLAYTAGSQVPTVTFKKIMGPSQIGPSETIAASYWVSANFTASATVPVNFDSKEYDTHGAVTTSATAWKFTAPASGLYRVSTFVNTAGTAYGQIFKNGSVYKTIGYINGSAPGSNTTEIRLNAGDFIDVRPNASITVTGSTLSSTTGSLVSISRVGL